MNDLSVPYQLSIDYRWMAADWSECVPYCGPGTRRREVYCVQTAHNVTVHVPDTFCENGTRPVSFTVFADL